MTDKTKDELPDTDPVYVYRQYSPRLGRWSKWTTCTHEFYEQYRHKVGAIEWRIALAAQPGGSDNDH